MPKNLFIQPELAQSYGTHLALRRRHVALPVMQEPKTIETSMPKTSSGLNGALGTDLSSVLPCLGNALAVVGLFKNLGVLVSLQSIN